MSSETCPSCGTVRLPGGAPGSCPRCLLRLGATPSDDESRLIEQPGDFIGPYKLIEVLGEGGFGTVWTAEQTKPVRRRVALKIIKLGMDTREVVARFEAERQALALMDHPGIARVFDAGSTSTGRPYFVMEWVRGVSLNHYCETHRLPLRARIELFIEVCLAVQHAHQKGIIHRDLKPSNILVTDVDDKPVPKVIDFGIARATAQHLTDKTLFTATNRVVGTPAYMSPEQAGLGGLDVDTRSDVYSLGVLLYELMTGCRVFSAWNIKASDSEAMLRAIREFEVPRPSTQLGKLGPAELAEIGVRFQQDSRKLCQELRGEIDWIVLKALEKDRTRRYETANGLATDLRRYLDGDVVRAAPPSLAYQATKFARRHKTALATAIAFAVVLILAVIVSTIQAIRATRAAQVAEERRLEAVRMGNQLDQMTQVAFAANNAVAEHLLEQHDELSALTVLLNQLPLGNSKDRRGWLWRYLWRETVGDDPVGFLGHTSEVTGLALSSDGSRLLSCSWDGSIREWNTASGRESRPPLVTGTNRWNSIALSPSGRTAVAVEMDENRAAVIDLATGTPRLVQLEKQISLFWLRAAPDGTAYSYSYGGWGFTSHNGLTILRDSNFENPRELPESGSRSAFSPDGKLLATGSWQGKIKLWNWPDLSPAGEMEQVGPVASLAFSPDGQRLAVGAALGELSLWQTKSHTKIAQQIVPGGNPVGSVQFSHDGRVLATAGGSGIHLWSSTNLAPDRELRSYLKKTWQAIFTENDRTIYSGTTTNGIRRWTLDPPRFISHRGLSQSQPVRFSADSKLAASILSSPGNDPSTAVVWSSLDGRELGRIPGVHGVLGYAMGENSLIVEIPGESGLRGTLAYHDVGNLSFRRSVQLEPVSTRIELGMSSELSPDGRTLVRPAGTGEVVVYDATTGRVTHVLRVNNRGVRKAVFSHDNQWLLTCGMERIARLWDLRQFKVVHSFETKTANSWEVVFSPDDSKVLIGALDGHYSVFDRASGEHLAAFFQPEGGVGAFTDDEKSVVIGATKRLHFFQWATGRQAGSIPLSGAIGQWLTLSPDGTRLAAVDANGNLNWFHAPSLSTIDARR